MKNAFKAKLFNTQSFKARNVTSYNFKANYITEHKFDVMISCMARFFGLKEDFSMMFSFDASTPLLIIKSKSDIGTGEFSFAALDKEILNSKSNIDVGSFEMELTSIFTAIKEYLDLSLNTIEINACFNETLKSDADINVGGFNIVAELINGVYADSSFDVGEIDMSVSDYYVIVYERPLIDLGDINISAAFKELSKLNIDINMLFGLNASSRSIEKLHNDISLGGFSGDATTLMWHLFKLGAIDPFTLEYYDNMTFENIERRLVE